MPPVPDNRPLAHVSLSLYVVGTSPVSTRAIVNVLKLCDQHLPDRYQLNVIDLTKQPAAAAHAQIIAVPTLVKSLPAPERRLIGDMSDSARVLDALGITHELRQHGR